MKAQADTGLLWGLFTRQESLEKLETSHGNITAQCQGKSYHGETVFANLTFVW